MLSKQERLPRGAFLVILKRGRTLSSVLLSFKYIKAENSRFSVVISKKVVKTAARRNLLKRRIYSSVQEFLKRKDPGVQGVFFVRVGADKLSFRALGAEISGLLERT